MNLISNRSKLTPTSLLVLLIVVGALVYQYYQGGLDLGQSPSKPPTVTPELDVPTSGQPGQFDFYVLVLSWSPEYCATNGSDDPQQCSIGRKLGFVLHGLWPQYNRGYPSDCSTSKLPADVKAKFSTLYPSPNLFEHEWEKHGTCAGLTPEQYLTLSKRLKDSIVVPDSYRAPEQPFRVTTPRLKQEFSTANSNLNEASLAVYCSDSGRFLQELYVCFSLEGKPVACSSEIQSKASRSCGSPDFLVQNVR